MPVAAPAADQPVVPAVPTSPMDEFKGMWEPVPNKEGEGLAPTMAVTPEAVQKAVAKADFMGGVKAEHLAAISEGGEGATAALSAMMNQVAQQTLAQSTLINNKLLENALANQAAKHAADLPAMLRAQASAEHMKNTNPLFSNPAVKPVADAAKAALLVKHPDASAAEITTMTENFIVSMGEQFAPKPAVTVPGESDTDWEKFLS